LTSMQNYIKNIFSILKEKQSGASNLGPIS
jgi:hypothetical protein